MENKQKSILHAGLRVKPAMTLTIRYKKLKLTLLFIISYSIIQLFNYSVFAQTKNFRDADGLKQGYWEAVDSKGMPVYRGYFKDDKPVGEMKRFFPTGELRLILNYDNTNNFARVRFFFPNGRLAAQGNYIDNKRDSIWIFYNPAQTVSSRVEYSAGKRYGLEQKFYPDGSIAEETNWKNDIKEGEWKQYFSDGQLKISTTYINDKIEGNYTSYTLYGKKETEGIYRDGVPDGDWTRFDIDGNYASTIKYDKGVITNFDELDEDDITMFTKFMEDDKGLPEPSIEDLIREMLEAQLMK